MSIERSGHEVCLSSCSGRSEMNTDSMDEIVAGDRQDLKKVGSFTILKFQLYAGRWPMLRLYPNRTIEFFTNAVVSLNYYGRYQCLLKYASGI